MDDIQKTIDYFRYKLVNGSLSKSRRKQYETAVSAMQELQQYRELEKQGRLIKLPCKKGSVIWDNDFGRPCSYEVTGFSYGNLNDDCLYEDEEAAFNTLIIHYSNSSGSISGSFGTGEFGKTVFLTREAAEKALKGG